MSVKFKDIKNLTWEGTILGVKLTSSIIEDIAIAAGIEYENDRHLSVDDWLAEECDLTLEAEEYYDIWMLDSYLDGTDFDADTFFDDYEVDSVGVIQSDSYESWLGVNLK